MSTLIDRYVFTALKSIPENQRSDIDRELRGSISDAVEARVDAGETPAAAETAVLTEFGDPARLAARYADRPLYLIGPDLFLDWWRLLKTLLIIVVPLAVVANLVIKLALDPADIGGAIGSAIGLGLGVVVHIAFWVTLAFYILQSTGTRRSELGLAPWTPEQLPQLPRRSQVSLADTVASVIMLGIFIAVLIWQHFGSALYLNGEPVPVLNEGLWSFWLPYVIVLLAVEIAFAVALYLRGYWTWGFAAANTVLGLLFMVPVLWLLATDQVYNWAFLAEANWDGVNTGWINGITAAFVLFIGLWDIGDGFVKAWKAERQEAPREPATV